MLPNDPLAGMADAALFRTETRTRSSKLAEVTERRIAVNTNRVPVSALMRTPPRVGDWHGRGENGCLGSWFWHARRKWISGIPIRRPARTVTSPA